MTVTDGDGRIAHLWSAARYRRAAVELRAAGCRRWMALRRPRPRAGPLDWLAPAADLPPLPGAPAGPRVLPLWRGRSLPRRPGRRAAGGGPAPAPRAGPGPARTATGLPLPPADRLTRGGGPAPDRRWSWPVLSRP